MFGTTQAVTNSCENAGGLSEVPTGSRSCIRHHPSPNKTGSSLTQRCHWKNVARKIILAPPPPRRVLLFSRRMFTLPLGFLKLFSFILVCTFFQQKHCDLVFRRDHWTCWDLPHTARLWSLVVLADMSACALCTSVLLFLSCFSVLG